MNLTLIAYLAAAAAVFGGGFGTAWKWQAANINEIQLERANERIAIQRQARATLERNMSAVRIAQSNAAARAVRLAADQRNSASALDSLRTASASALRSAAGDLEACTRSLAAHSVVVGKCSQEVVKLASDLDDWASHSIVLQDAWNK